MARSASARPPKATSARVDSSAGLITARVFPPVASTHWPSMYIRVEASAVGAMVFGLFVRALSDRPGERLPHPDSTITARPPGWQSGPDPPEVPERRTHS